MIKKIMNSFLPLVSPGLNLTWILILNLVLSLSCSTFQEPSERALANSVPANNLSSAEDVIGFFTEIKDWKVCDSQNQTVGSYLSRFEVVSKKTYKAKVTEAGQLVKFVVHGGQFEWKQNNKKTAAYAVKSDPFKGAIIVGQDRSESTNVAFNLGDKKFTLTGATENGMIMTSELGAFEVVPASARCSTVL